MFLTTIESVVDSLCFYKTHTIDDDWRSHSKTALETIRVLQTDQQQRLESSYGPQPPSPEFLASQLDELYRMDAQNVLHAQETKQNSVVDVMSLATAKIFKREMKIRIHEWEGAFRLAHGREATTQEKASLRGIYELYKAVKLKVQKSELGPEEAQPPDDRQVMTRPNPRRVTEKVVNTPQPPVRPGSAPSPLTVQRGEEHGPSTPRAPATTHQKAIGPTQTTASSPSSREHHDPIAANDVAALIAEKKSLKRRLHQFEDEFKQANGRVPTKDDRKVMSKDYARYGELKALLAQHNDADHGD